MAIELENALAGAALSERERRVLARLTTMLDEELGSDLLAVWLFGSRARGDAVIDDSDVDLKSDIDLMVIAEGGRPRYNVKAIDLVHAAAEAEGDSPAWYSILVGDPEWLDGRRQIRSFFIQAVDRDKLVLYGSAIE